MYIFTTIFLLIFSISIFIPDLTNSAKTCSLDKYIRYYEAITQSLKNTKQGTQTFTIISFHAFNRLFRLKLWYDDSILHDSTPIIIRNGKEEHELSPKTVQSNIVTGLVDDEENESSVTGVLENAMFQGVIRLKTESYHVEDATRYHSRPVPYQSIIFKQSDVISTMKNQNNSFCNQKPKKGGMGETKLRNETVSETAAQVKSNGKPLKLHGKTLCHLKLIADHTFFQNATDHRIIGVVLEMILLLQQAQSIFSKTDFDGDGESEGIGFQVHAIQIILSRYSPNYKLYKEYMDIEDYLDLFADYDFDNFCLGVSITHRQFPSGALGVTYTASPDHRKAGGICQKRRRAKGYKKPKSYNAVVVTVVGNDGQLMPRFLNGLTIAHELGHAFGSDHDPQDNLICSPKAGGDFLMSRYTLLGNDMNNFLFSTCSKRQIADVLREKGTCFVHQKSICGNAIIEDGEECDCGTADQCQLIDPCCTPKGGLDSDEECTVRTSQGFVCSPFGKPCCNPNCNYVPAHEEKDCTGGNDCFFAATCTGLSAECPVPRIKQQGLECRGGIGRCHEGKCEDVTCAKRKLRPCICKHFSKQCELCCERDDKVCRPAAHYGIFQSRRRPFLRPVGDECDEGRGYCNFGGICASTMRKGSGEIERIEERKSPPGPNRGVTDLLTVLAICVLVVSVVSLLLVALYLYTPCGSIVQAWRY